MKIMFEILDTELVQTRVGNSLKAYSAADKQYLHFIMRATSNRYKLKKIRPFLKKSSFLIIVRSISFIFCLILILHPWLMWLNISQLITEF